MTEKYSRPDSNNGDFKHRPRKRFGQNFLHDAQVIHRIISAIAPQPTDHVVEIGPGQGALTQRLLASDCQFDCIELDRDLAAYLTETLKREKTFTIHQGDVRKFDFRSLTLQPKSLRIVGNLPYNISTPVMFYLLAQADLIRDMTFMLQREVVQRLAAAPGDKNYGRLGLMAQYYCKIEHLFDVPASAFTPAPKVTSAIVRMRPYTTPPIPARDVSCLQNVIRTAFSQRRKTLRNSLSTLICEEQLKALGLDVRLRPENLSLADYVTISDAITN